MKDSLIHHGIYHIVILLNTFSPHYKFSRFKDISNWDCSGWYGVRKVSIVNRTKTMYLKYVLVF